MNICTDFYTGYHTLTSDETLFANTDFGVVPFGIPVGERLQHKGMEPLRLTCGASSDPVGRHSYVVTYLFNWGRTWI